MAGNVSGIHVFAADVGPEALSLLDGVNNAFISSLNSLISFSNNYIDSGAVNSLVVTVPSPQVFAYVDGVLLNVKVAVTNTSTTPVINVNGLGSKSIVNPDGSAIPVGKFVAGGWISLEYDIVSGKFMHMSGGSPTVSSLLASNNTWTGTNQYNNNVTMGPPAAGAALTAVGFASAGQPTVVVDSSLNTASFVQWQTGGVAIGNIGNGAVFGSVSGDFVVAPTTGTLRLWSATNGQALSVVSAGNVSVAPPSSGVPLTLNGSSYLLNLVTSTARGGGFCTLEYNDPTGLKAQVGFAANADDLYVSNELAGNLFMRTSGISRLNINSTGNVSIPAPSSGTPFTVVGVNGSSVVQITSGNSATQGTTDLFVSRAGSTANALAEGPNYQLNDTTNNTSSLMQHAGGQTEIWQFNGAWHQLAFWTSNGRNLQLNAGVSGIGPTLTINGGGSTYAIMNLNPGFTNQNLFNYTQAGLTGTGTPTLGTNKPTASSAVAGWIPVFVNSVQCYIPFWN